MSNQSRKKNQPKRVVGDTKEVKSHEERKRICERRLQRGSDTTKRYVRRTGAPCGYSAGCSGCSAATPMGGILAAVVGGVVADANATLAVTVCSSVDEAGTPMVVAGGVGTDSAVKRRGVSPACELAVAKNVESQKGDTGDRKRKT